MIHTKPQKSAPALACLALSLVAVTATSSAIGEAGSDDLTARSETTELLSADSPRWLAAVGKLEVPGIKYHLGRRHNHKENCSATLISKKNSAQANVIATAWHCLEFYTDLSKPIIFTLRNGTDRRFSIEARILADGGGMHADWALLRLQTALPKDKFEALQLHATDTSKLRTVTMAGYSNDGHNSEYGQRLTYHLSCHTFPAAAPGFVASDCIAMKGASGGAVTQITSDGVSKLRGVISRGNGKDFSEYVPVEVFRLTALNYL